MSIDRTDINTIYSRTIDKIKSSINKRNYNLALKHIVFAAQWMYDFNLIYSDPHIDKTISDIACLKLNVKTIDTHSDDKVVLIDNFGLDNRGLTQQYLRALIADNRQILYILHNPSPIENSEIIRELKEYDKATIKIYKTSKNDYITTAQNIINDIAKFGSKDIFIHIAPWDVTTLLAISALKGATVYNINLTDHAFWLGSTLIDYNLEFRGYGERLSIEKRGLKKSQLIKIPYYPIRSKYTPFAGFPHLPDDAVKIFCGGAEYKMLGKDGIFFKLMDAILDCSKNIHILVAGISKTSTFGNLIQRMRNYDRVHLIGIRKDIDEVFAHSDIYLSSYPFMGGLMTQYAAQHRLPILAYAEPGEVNTCDMMVNHLDHPVKMRRSLDEFRAYAKKLADDPLFRKKEGEACHNAMITRQQFDQMISQILSDKTTNIYFVPEQPDYNSIEDFYLDVENNYTHAGATALLSHYRLKALYMIPRMTPLFLCIGLKKIKSKIFKR